MAIERYHGLLDEYYRAWFYHHPDTAVDLGIEGYAGRMTPYGDDDNSALIRLHEKLLDAIEEMDLTALHPDQHIDVELMRGQASIERRGLLEQDWRITDPSAYLPVNSIYQLTVREVKDPAAAFRGRLAAIPEYLRGARTQLRVAPERIPAVWLQAAVHEAEIGAGYFRELTHHPRLQTFGLDNLFEQAALALEDYARFLDHELAPQAHGDVACGRGMFETWLQCRHGLDISADQLHAFGERLYARVEDQLRAVTRQLRGDDDIAAMTEHIRREFATQGGLLGHYREHMLAARGFVQAHALVSLPAEESLIVVETPQFMRHRIPFAAYWQPMPTDTKQRGIYYVTLPKDAQSEGEHNLLELRHTCVHEAWPGHHLQFVVANRAPQSRSVPRLVNTSATLYEGWALYSEQLMCEQGFLNRPESQFVLLKDRLWRALRIMLDVEIHTRQANLTVCAQKMQAVLGFTREQAEAEVYWYSRAPTVPMGYATGWSLINAAREQIQSTQASMPLREFHDRLLSAGSIALPTVLRRAFDAALWPRLRERLFLA
ncbi:MAG: DUF885 domain-containing protein [Gammaproteobacteria bacterium]|nr:DUF885 domain-containing protein [Gammaproteobacteria bacterium]